MKSALVKVINSRIVYASTLRRVKHIKKRLKPIVVRGREVSVRDSALQQQVTYGRMRVGGAITFIDTTQESYAYLVTGSSEDDNELIWTAKTAGADGNDVTVRLWILDTHGSVDVTVTDNAIDVRLASDLFFGVPGSITPATTLISAIEGDSAANALVSIERLNGLVDGIVSPVSTTPLAYGGGKVMFLVDTIAGHQIDAIETLYLDNRAVTFGGAPDGRWGTGIWAERVFMALNSGHPDQTAQADFVGQMPTVWTSAHRQRGCAGAFLILVWNQNLFTEGFPAIEFLIRGKLCLDFRTAGTSWNNNPVVCLADYLTNPVWGYGISWSDIDSTSFTAAANVCDEEVDLDAGGTEPRYVCNGVFDAGDDVLQELLTCFDGILVEQEGKFFCYAGAFRAASDTIVEDDLRGTIEIRTATPRSENFNAVRGTYVSPDDGYNETDIPPVINSTYATEDGGTVWADIRLNFVTSVTQAQRLLKIGLERVRQGISLVIPLKLSKLGLVAGDTVEVTLARFGWSAKEFEVLEVHHVFDGTIALGVDVLLQETASEIYDWDAEETAIDVAPNTTLPSPYDVDEPTSVTLTSGTSELYIRDDGTVQTRLKISWVEPTSEFVSFGGGYEIQHKRSSASDWSLSTTIPGGFTFYHITDVEDGVLYDVRIRASNSLQYFSDWVSVTGHEVLGKSEPPSNLTTYNASVLGQAGIRISWDQITDVDLSHYQIRYTNTGQTWASSTVIANTKANEFIWSQRIAGIYRIYIKPIDTSGNESTNDHPIVVTISAPTAPTISSTIDGTDCVLSWPAVTSQLGVKEYEIRYGATFETATTLATLTGLTYQFPVNWGGSRTFYVYARDIADNAGSVGSLVVTISNPAVPATFNLTVFQNNVLLDWDEPTITSLPIAKYRVYKGATFGSATSIGIVTGTFQIYAERVGGDFTYWVLAEDTAGNLSDPTDETITVSDPENFFIRSDVNLVPYWTGSERAIKGGTIYYPSGDENSFYLPMPATDEETASLPLMILQTPETLSEYADVPPTTTDAGYIEFHIDYGITFSSIFIDFTWSEEVLGGSTTITPQISTSADDSTWTDYSSTSSVVGTSFRYAKYRLDFQGAADTALSRIYDLRARLSLKKAVEKDIIDVYAADSGGTTVTFTLPFLDIEDLQVTPIGSAELKAVSNFTDAPNPTSFKILLYDAGGSRTDGTVSYRAEGTVEPD